MSKNVAELIESIALLEAKQKEVLRGPQSVFGVFCGALRYLNAQLMLATKGEE